MDFDDPEVFPQYNPPLPPMFCPRNYDEEEPPDICIEQCRVFVCPFMEKGGD